MNNPRSLAQKAKMYWNIIQYGLDIIFMVADNIGHFIIILDTSL